MRARRYIRVVVGRVIGGADELRLGQRSGVSAVEEEIVAAKRNMRLDRRSAEDESVSAVSD